MKWLLVGVWVAVVSGCALQKACDATTCRTGCCNTDGFCQSGTTNELCGVGANQCISCSAGRDCQRGLCVKSVDGGP